MKYIEDFLSNKEKKEKDKLLLHCCCGPCSTYVIEYLKDYFDITAYYYNPNIFPLSEYDLRLEELKKVLLINDIPLIIGEYEEDKFYEIAKGKEEEKEGLRRCEECMKFRLLKTRDVALNNNFKYFTTTLSISPYKNSEAINRIGQEIEDKNTIFIYSNFKKNEGYKKSILLCKKYNIYRQHYCGCMYSLKNSVKERNN